MKEHASLAAIFSSCLGVGLIFGLQPPLIALALARTGESSFVTGAVIGASLIAVIVLGPFYPRVIERFGLRSCVVLGVCCAAGLLLAMPLWPVAGAWLVLRLLTGCALGLSWIASEVWLNGVSRADTRGTVMGIYGTVFSAGVMCGPALLEATGTRGARPFVVGALCLLVTLLPLVALRRTDGVPQRFLPLRGLGAALRRAPGVMAAALVAGLVESAGLTLLPLFAVHAGFSDHRALGLVTVFMAGNVALQVPIGWLADRWGLRFMLGCCAAASAVGPVLLGPTIMTSWVWVVLFGWGGTVYAFYSLGVALLGIRFAAQELPAVNTVFVMVYCLGGILGPIGGGILMDAWPAYGLQSLLSAAACLLLAGILAAPRARRTPRVPRQRRAH